MRRQKQSNAELLLKLPWWASAALGVITFSAMRWGLPAWAGTDNSRLVFSRGIVPLAPLALGIFGVFATGSFWFGRHPVNDNYNSPLATGVIPHGTRVLGYGVAGISWLLACSQEGVARLTERQQPVRFGCGPFEILTILARWAGTCRVGGGLTEIRPRVEPLIRVQCTPLGFQRDNLCQQPL